MTVKVEFGPNAGKLRTADLTYKICIYDVSEDLFDELTDEDTKAELIDGVMVVHAAASPRHDAIGNFARTLMLCHADGNDLGKVFGPDALVHLATCRKFAADAFFLVKRRVPTPLPEKEFDGAPDLALEVLSPSNRDDDLEDKRPAYRQAGVKEIWFIDPENREVIVDRRRGQRYTTRTTSSGRVTSAVLAGFWVEASWLWADPLPNVLTCLRQLLGEGAV